MTKITRSNVISEVSGLKLTKFVHNVATSLPFNLLKMALQSSSPLSNARAKSKGR